MSKAIKKTTASNEEDKKFPLPIYNEKDDIYNKEKEIPYTEEEDISPEGNLDIPGSELDDEDEDIGEEDEENNYYSLGGDDHDDLEETNEDNVERRLNFVDGPGLQGPGFFYSRLNSAEFVILCLILIDKTIAMSFNF